MNQMSIPEPKVEHHEGRGIRSCPIFPELRPILDEAFDIFGDKTARQRGLEAPAERLLKWFGQSWNKDSARFGSIRA
jgi:hypothetical protein